MRTSFAMSKVMHQFSEKKIGGRGQCTYGGELLRRLWRLKSVPLEGDSYGARPSG